MRAKTPVKPWKSKKKDESRPALEGMRILSGETEVIVLYKNKKWDLKDLIQFLANEVNRLKKNECVPKVGCVFKGQKFLDQKYYARLVELEKYYAPYLDISLFDVQEEIEQEAAEAEEG